MHWDCDTALLLSDSQMSAQIYSELIEDYFITNIKGDLFQDSDETQPEQEEHTDCKFVLKWNDV